MGRPPLKFKNTDVVKMEFDKLVDIAKARIAKSSKEAHPYEIQMAAISYAVVELVAQTWDRLDENDKGK